MQAISSAFILLFSDVLALSLSGLLGLQVRTSLNELQGLPGFSISSLNPQLLFAFSFIVIFFQFESGVYRRRQLFSSELKQIIRSLIIAYLVIFAIVSLGKFSDDVSRLLLAFSLGFVLILLPLTRYFSRRLLYATKLSIEPVLIIGAGEAGIAAARELRDSPLMGFDIIGFIDDSVKDTVVIDTANSELPVIGNISSLKEKVNKHGIKTVIFAIPSMSAKESSALVAIVQPLVERVLVVPDLKGVAILNSELMHLFSEQMFLIRVQNNLQRWENRLVKRCFDISFCVLLLPFIAPFLVLFSFLVKVESSGPAFFRQKRQGKDGIPFYVWKFRSMYKDADVRLKEILSKDPVQKKEWDTYFKLKNDPRITKTGRFLRETSLDELPQIINVFVGDMSLVGPRPVLEQELEEYYGDYALYYNSVRPGISGLWQVSGRNDVDYEKRVALDTWYVLNWSLWFDLVILYKTVFVVLNRKGAY
jgi:Undecaprenyl-phosphate galactose phosphotransferase WbaP